MAPSGLHHHTAIGRHGPKSCPLRGIAHALMKLLSLQAFIMPHNSHLPSLPQPPTPMHIALNGAFSYGSYKYGGMGS